MSIHHTSPNPHIRLGTAIGLGVAAAVLLAGCALQRQSQGSQPGSQGDPATQVVVQPGPVLNLTDSALVTPAGGAPVNAGEPAVEATSEADTLGDTVEQDLQQLDDLNKSTDLLDDQP